MFLPSPSLRALVLVGVLALGAAACSDDSSAEGPTATVGTVPETTTTTVGVDQVPAELTVEYLQRVVDALDESWGAMFRQYKADNGPTPDNLAWLAELYAEPEYGRMEREFGILTGDRFDGVHDQPGHPVTQIRKVIRDADGCVLLDVQRSFDQILSGDPLPDGDEDSYLALKRRPLDQAITSRNPTAWHVVLDAISDEVPTEACT